MSFEADCVVIGAGVIGIAVARELQLRGRQVLLLEREARFGSETSSRNSEVIHAGIYYPPGSLKARFCVEGRERLYRYCETHHVPHRRIGKLIVGVDEGQVPTLEHYVATARANGVDDLQWLDEAAVRSREPAVRGVCGLLSPSTGIVDSHAYMTALLGQFQSAGGEFITHCPVASGRIDSPDGDIALQLDDAERSQLRARCVVNSAGLHAPAVAGSIAGLDARHVPQAHFAIGHYYVLGGRAPFSQLVYPVAAAGGLGVHVTLDLAGQAKFGPDIRWREGIDYTFDDSRRAEFVQAIRAYYPGLDEQRLLPGYTGIRPKISDARDPNRDFVIQDAGTHGLRGLINLFGIESPGLTSSLALAREVADRVAAHA